MTPGTDHDLLCQFVESQSESAFAGLIARHINLVYSVALRQAGNPHHAQEITQAVFITLARKAGQLRNDRALSSWLFQTTRLTANNFQRSEFRRQRREQEAYMQSNLNEPAGNPWPHIAPLLDGAVEALGETDRRAIVLRFYEGRSLQEVGAGLGTSEEAAKKRVGRALEKLRKFFAKKGVALSATVIATAVSANAVQSAPAGLAATIAAAALSGTAATTALLATTTKTIVMTTLQKFAVTAALTATIGAGLYEATQAAHARLEVQQLQQEQAPLTAQIQQLQAQLDGMTDRLKSLAERSSKNRGDNSELLKLRNEVGVLRRQSEDSGQNAQKAEQQLKDFLSAQTQFNQHESAIVNNAKQVGLAMLINANDNNGHFAGDFEQLTNELGGRDKAIVGAAGFELINKGLDSKAAGVDLTDLANTENAKIVLFRERYTRQSPDGTWHRAYNFVDGRVITATSYDGSFDAWEKANTYSPPADQNQQN